MKNSIKIWLAITGILLVALGLSCLFNPGATLVTMAWFIGFTTLFAGISKLVFTFKTEEYMPNSGSRMLSGVFDIVIGLIFLCNSLGLAASLPFVFAIWIMMEGIVVAIQSFDYKKQDYKGWWLVLILGIATAVFGFFGLRNPVNSGKLLSTLVGLGVLFDGFAHLVAFAGLSHFQKRVQGVKDAVNNFRDR